MKSILTITAVAATLSFSGLAMANGADHSAAAPAPAQTTAVDAAKKEVAPAQAPGQMTDGGTKVAAKKHRKKK